MDGVLDVKSSYSGTFPCSQAAASIDGSIGGVQRDGAAAAASDALALMSSFPLAA